MIGNDLVFSNIRNKPDERIRRSLKKVLADTEFEVLSDFDLYEKMSIAWSIKEACFKYCRRFEQLLFQPKSFVVQQIADQETTEKTPFNENDLERKGFAGIPHKVSIVKTPLETLICKSIITENYVHSIVTNDPKGFDEICWGVSQIDSSKYKDQSLGVREKARTHLLKVNNRRPDTNCYFQKDERQVPIIYINGVECEVALSFSHDHYFIAYAWCTI